MSLSVLSFLYFVHYKSAKCMDLNALFHNLKIYIFQSSLLANIMNYLFRSLLEKIQILNYITHIFIKALTSRLLYKVSDTVQIKQNKSNRKKTFFFSLSVNLISFKVPHFSFSRPLFQEITIRTFF